MENENYINFLEEIKSEILSSRVKAMITYNIFRTIKVVVTK